MQQTFPRFILLAALLVLLSSGCATAYWKTGFVGIGEFSQQRNEAVQARFVASQKRPPAEAAAVKVLYETIPPGVVIREKVISIKEGYPLQIVGRFHGCAPPRGGTGSFQDYTSGARKGYCYWQVPLTWLTIGFWALLPLNYPCWLKRPTLDQWQDKLRLLAHAAGGNLVLTASGFSRGVVIRASPEYLAKMNAPRRQVKPAQERSTRPPGALEI